MYKNILVPIDFSTESAKATETATHLAKSENAKVTLLNVIEDPYTTTYKTIGGLLEDIEKNSFIIELKKRIEEKLEGLVKTLRKSGTEIDYVIKTGNVFGVISDYIKSSEIDLVIMGSKGSSDLDEVLVGSITEKVVKYVECPVVTIKEKADLTKIKSILYPTDLKEEQEEILEEIKELQQKHNAHLHLVKVFDSEFITQREVEERMKKFASYFHLTDYSVSAIKHADEAEAILQFADNIDASLIAMATHYRRGMEVLFNTRISKNVVNHAKRPILTKRVN